MPNLDPNAGETEKYDWKYSSHDSADTKKRSKGSQRLKPMPNAFINDSFADHRKPAAPDREKLLTEESISSSPGRKAL